VAKRSKTARRPARKTTRSKAGAKRAPFVPIWRNGEARA
jgi:hypothetical protein